MGSFLVMTNESADEQRAAAELSRVLGDDFARP
jgi:hypothetical protein